EARIGLRPRLGLLEQELRQPEDREERVVDLVRDTGRELADRGELAALDELLLEPALAGEGGVEAEERDRRAIVAVDRVRLDLDGDRMAVAVAEDARVAAVLRERPRRLVLGPPRVRVAAADDLGRVAADELAEGAVRVEHLAGRRVGDEQRDR